jgi:hypothetical protein
MGIGTGVVRLGGGTMFGDNTPQDALPYVLACDVAAPFLMHLDNVLSNINQLNVTSKSIC